MQCGMVEVLGTEVQPREAADGATSGLSWTGQARTRLLPMQTSVTDPATTVKPS